MHHLGRFCFKTRLNYPNNRPVINKFLSDFLCTEFEGEWEEVEYELGYLG